MTKAELEAIQYIRENLDYFHSMGADIDKIKLVLAEKEKTSMDRVQKHEEICKELNDIYKRKNHDYGNSFGDTFAKLGIISAVTRISDKTNRLMSLCVKEQQVADENIKDTLKDLANYAIMTIIELGCEEEGE